MLTRLPWREAVGFLIGAALIVFVVWASGLLPDYVEYCYDNQAGHKECATYYIAFVALWEIGKGLSWISPAVTAIATGFIAWFTWTLWQSSEKSWLASRRSADIAERALIASNRAWLSIEDVKLIHPTKIAEDKIIFRVSATIKHHGETPATSVWMAFESYFIEENETPFIAAQEQFRAKLRGHWSQMGESLFKSDTFTMCQLWADGPDKIKKAITTRPSAERRANFTIFIGVSYRVVGDQQAHITQYAYSMLNVLVGTEIPQGKEIDLPRQPFLAGQID